ncbi:molybdenum cofactor guanylyltransferase [Sporolituus thermophilus]|uniref:Probable molybdenum cofactor guanylyltransferase n=1 Tax=Sporolituus thermophilus DSM 23256 TaxID=1123285 RepID=A0A1G7MLR8_9FIRM|nr:molybdenum cofactor guanylyltransferase [Sporolituus thermophilus]SDF62691.1 molybdopterin-guanine dinucleotide biosynthesis protein A [Sporolituus thermophilus DSM 23256]
MKLTGIVLAGGLSTRMGRDKATLPFSGSDLLHTVLARLAPVCDYLLVVSNVPREIRMPDVTVVPDKYPQCGPLAGMHAGLKASVTAYNFLVACDMPFLSSQAVAYMAGAAQGFDAAVPFIDGYYHPLHAIYHQNCLKHIELMLQAGNYRVLDFYPLVALRRIGAAELRRFDPELKTLDNINTPEDLAKLRQ